MALRAGFGIVIALLTVLVGVSWAASNPIGFFAAVQGSVSVTHPEGIRPQMVRVNDNVLFKDLIETRQASRMKTLLEDDTVLTLGESSRLEITEHLYDPTAKTRSAVLRLLRGKVRALVARTFGASKFEIHTASAVVAARGTYFVVWIGANGATGVANMGTHGDVAFTAGGKELILKPGQTSTAKPGGAPESPSDISNDKAANEAIQATELTSTIASETSRETLTALGGTVTTLGNDLLAPLQLLSSDSLATTSQLTGSLSNTAGTVPAVISGAVGALNAPYNSVVSSTTTSLSTTISTITNPLTAPLSTTTTAVTTLVNPLLGPITTLK